MDSLRRSSTSAFYLSYALLFLLLFLPIITVRGSAGGVFKVKRKFVSGRHSIADLRNHDAVRHPRLLAEATDGVSAVDLPLGGNGLPTATGLYYTDIEIGTPPKNFTVQVDTGSDILWVNCAPCDGCPKKSNIGADLSPYNPNSSTTAKYLGCHETFCGAAIGMPGAQCPEDGLCTFRTVYGDGSSVGGHFVTDLVTYNAVAGDQQTHPDSASITFGCASHQTGLSGGGLEGLIGFGQANSSMISQLASAGKVRKIFAHCLDTIKGGGIFAIGNVVQPKVKTTPLIPNMSHYNVNMTSVEVGNKTIMLPFSLFWTNENSGTIIDSGATLAYLPGIAHKHVMAEIFAAHPDLERISKDGFTCFNYSENVDDAFPVVTFHFEMSVTLRVHPRDYFFQNQDSWCVGWQKCEKPDRFLLGDIALSNKLVVYDLENQAIGWTEYDCSSTIEVEDDAGKAARVVDAHTPSPVDSSAREFDMGRIMASLVFLLCSLNVLFQLRN